MLKLIKGLVFFTALSAASFSAMAQEVVYQGVVLDNQHKPIPGANVFVSGGGGTATTAEGRFRISLTIPAQVKISFFGYESKTINLREAPLGIDTIVLNEEEQSISPVVVTANRRGQNLNEVTQTMELIKPNFLIETQTVQIQKTIDKIPGIVVQKDQVSIRGASGFSYGAGSRVLVMLDDMPMLSADASDPKWNSFPIENVNQVEILKGAASALYGSAAMEGIIHLRTAVAADTPWTMVKAYAGFYDRPKGADSGFWKHQATPLMTNGITVAHRQSFGNLKVTASATFNNDDGYRNGDNTYVSRANLFMMYTPKNNPRLQFTFSANGMEDVGSFFLFAGNVRDEYDPAPGTSSPYHDYRWHTDFSARFFETENVRHIFRTRYFTTINSNNSQSSTGHLWYNEYQYINTLYKQGTTETNLTAGANYIYSQTISDSLYHNHAGDNVAAYAQFDQKFGPLSFNIGGRLEANKVDTFSWDKAPVFRAGLNYQPFKYTYLRASFGQGFRYPSVAERFASTSAGAINIVPNPQLQAEKGYSSEVGIRQLFGGGALRGFADLSGFYSEYHNMIEYVLGYYPPTPSTPFNPKYFGFKAKNLQNTLIEGAELSFGVDYKVQDWKFELTGGYTYVLPYNKDSMGKKLKVSYHEYLTFRHKDMVKANLSINYKKWGAGFYGMYNSPMLNIDPYFFVVVSGLETNNYWQTASTGFMGDVRLSYQLNSKLGFSLFVKNITNIAYMEVPGNVSAPRTYQVQMTWVF